MQIRFPTIHGLLSELPNWEVTTDLATHLQLGSLQELMHCEESSSA
jgi:hypothetical protein